MFKSKHILILEDDPDRVRKFKRKFIGNVIEIVDTPADAIFLLEHRDWDVLFLDHDLGGEISVPSGEGTGYEVAEWLSNHLDRMPEKVILHSLSRAGRENMKRVLPESVEMPWVWLSDE